MADKAIMTDEAIEANKVSKANKILAANKASAINEADKLPIDNKPVIIVSSSFIFCLNCLSFTLS